MRSWHAPDNEISEPYFFRGAGWKFCRQSRECWVQRISIQHRPVIPGIKTSVICPLLGRYSVTRLIMEFPQYLHTIKHHNSIHQSATAGPYSPRRARGHVGCWMEFPPASLSEGWLCYSDLTSSIAWYFYHRGNINQCTLSQLRRMLDDFVELHMILYLYVHSSDSMCVHVSLVGAFTSLLQW